ncbi:MULTISPECIES: IclR family transcriptional regulator [Acetomicrobium]|uniref:IclR family transcriptional regulator n=1 Tax=Acetomicrobium TaxID=49894 RepID=UPI0026EA7C91|nr:MULTISPECIES: IclR family transcriptional regulator [Acetomicrobium]
MQREGKDSQSLRRALRLLSCFTFEKPEWGVTELAVALKEHKSVVHRILTTLLNNEFLRQDSISKKYRLGIRFFELGMVVAEDMQLRKVANPVMVELHEKTGETVMLLIEDEGECLCIDKVQSQEGIQCTSRIGKRTPLHAGFSKVLLAYLPEPKIKEIIKKDLQKFTDRTVTDPTLLLEQLSDIRKNGYVVTCGEVDKGSMCVGVPLRGYSGTVIGALSVVGPEFRMRPKISEILALALGSAQKISRHMGYNSNLNGENGGGQLKVSC